ncbi:MAG TPA: hypothetical protein PLU80_13680, partial [Acidobacteriota bacterium]|nr:hypothetical protein [Acidobacteriota bacterium]
MPVFTKRRCSRLLSTCLFLAVCLTSSLLLAMSFAPATASLGLNGAPGAQINRQPVMYRVSVANTGDVQRLIQLGLDVLEARGQGYVLVLGDQATPNQLAAHGFRAEVDPELTRRSGFHPQTFFQGYRTV